VQVTYNSWLVVTSLVVAILASYVALNLVANVAAARGRTASMVWLSGSAVAMGTGIWSMHFVGMLAASIGIQMTYHLGWTALSLLIAILISGFALYMVSSERLGSGKLLLCGAVMGAGIASMHYVGMGALQVSPGIQYDPWLFALSILIAMAALVRRPLAVRHVAFRQHHQPPAETRRERGRDGYRHRRHALHRHGRGGLLAGQHLHRAFA
jgi:NO-binding membrane sensor protein with MHYT domain